MITQPNLDTKKPVGNGINAPVYENGVANIISTKSADMTNSSTNINQTASSENLSAKFKNPSAKADVAPEAQGQYM
jgi:hypothetical protein